ncbi:MAG: chorismate synthase [Deltaproteobacteria bacterium]|nr:chorismate synthase [Deltaproteobacteria bacterium]
MAGNSIGQLFKVTTWGESHGEALGVVIDGCPSNIDLDVADLQLALNARKPGQGAHTTTRQETDTVEILSGVFAGKTTGTPLAAIVRNQDARSNDYDQLREVFRPGHGDYTYQHKYGRRDHRGGGRASGRETVARVIAGAVAHKVIARVAIEVLAYTKAIGNVALTSVNSPQRSDVLASVLFCPDPIKTKEMLALLTEVKAAQDSIGGIVEIVVRGCPIGLGEPVFDKLEADLAKALMSIGSVKGIEVGLGFASATLRGSQHNDAILPTGFASNNASGILAGISNGEEIILRIACKPLPSIGMEQRTINAHGEEIILKVGGRHDVCVIPRIVPVCEAMVSIVIADHLLRQEATAAWR